MSVPLFVSSILLDILSIDRTGSSGHFCLLFALEIPFDDNVCPTKCFEQKHNGKHFEEEVDFPYERPLRPICGLDISHEPKEFDDKYTDSKGSSHRVSPQVFQYSQRNTSYHHFQKQIEIQLTSLTISIF